MGLLSWLLKKANKEEPNIPANVTVSDSLTEYVSTTTEVVGNSESTTTKMRSNVRILIDNGHGQETAGKRSPDGRVMEWKYARDIAVLVVTQLKAHGYLAELVTPESTDVRISERVRRVNNVCAKHGASNVLLVSIHLNAAGSDGQWHDARGWQACVSLNASAKSMLLAECLADGCLEYGIKLRKPRPTQKWWEQNLGICRDTRCPAVLTENLFMDNKYDVEYLLTGAGRQTIVNTHVKGIMSYINAIGK